MITKTAEPKPSWRWRTTRSISMNGLQAVKADELSAIYGDFSKAAREGLALVCEKHGLDWPQDIPQKAG